MKKILFISSVFLILFSLNKGFSQYVVELSVDQPPALEADAGIDQSIEADGNVELGGTPAAYGGYGQYSYLWEPGNTLDDETKANPEASPEETTDYVLTVTDSLKCTDRDTVNVSVEVTNLPVINGEELAIYPNPARNVLNIEFPGNLQGNYTIKLIALSGKTVYSDRCNVSQGRVKQLPLADIPSGIYMVEISNENENVSAKIIIE